MHHIGSHHFIPNLDVAVLLWRTLQLYTQISDAELETRCEKMTLFSNEEAVSAASLGAMDGCVSVTA